MTAPVLLAFALLLGQAGTPSPQAPVHENRAPVQAAPAPVQQPASPAVDRLFALAAMQGNNAEIDMAQLALHRGSANEIKGYAGKMIAEHTGMMQEMMPALRRVLHAAAPPSRLARAGRARIPSFAVRAAGRLRSSVRDAADRRPPRDAHGIPNRSRQRHGSPAEAAGAQMAADDPGAPGAGRGPDASHRRLEPVQSRAASAAVGLRSRLKPPLT